MKMPDQETVSRWVMYASPALVFLNAVAGQWLWVGAWVAIGGFHCWVYTLESNRRGRK